MSSVYRNTIASSMGNMELDADLFIEFRNTESTSASVTEQY